MTGASNPTIGELRTKVDGPDSELTQAVIDALLEIQGLKTVDDVFAFDLDWDGQESALGQKIFHELGAFSFDFLPRRLTSDSIELSVTLSKSKTSSAKDKKKRVAEANRALLEGRLDKILETRLTIEIGSPVIIGIPAEDGPFFMMVLLKGPEPKAKREGGAGPSVVAAPKPIRTVMPAYPEELRALGVRGQVELQAAVDEKGNLMGLQVSKSLHPYLDFAAIQALRQWKYEPTYQGGKPVQVILTLAVNFDPEIYRLYEENALLPTGADPAKPSRSGILDEILEGSADYCRKLTGAALDFICEETIKEIHYSFAKEMSWSGIAVSPKGYQGQPIITAWTPSWDPQRTTKSDYTCDYLFVKKDVEIEERRIVLKANGHKLPDRNTLLEEKRFTALNPLLAATRILNRDRQPLFNFRLLETEKVRNRKAFVVEAIPKSGNTWGVEYAKIWIDQTGHQVLRSEIQGVPLEGYDDVLEDTSRFNIKPILTTTHTYEVEKNGVLFPTRTTIRVDYPLLQTWFSRRELKLKIEMEYNQYKFFTVETENVVKK
jgi:TonB family protein